MRNGERTILALLHARRDLCTPIRLVKMMFLLVKEGNVTNTSLYDFLPYKYGPFSFSLYRDTRRLLSNGWIVGTDLGLADIEEKEALQLSDARKRQAMDEMERLPSKIHKEVSLVERRYGEESDRSLLGKVYGMYPEYTFMSEFSQNEYLRPVADPAIYTIGYEGSNIDLFLDLLLQVGIQRLVDVRSNPVSRKWGFSKTSLADLCKRLNIEYLHVPRLGIQSQRRRDLHTAADYHRLLDEYEHRDIPRQMPIIKDLSHILKERASALLCMEADPTMCHRGRLAGVLQRYSGLEIHHIGGKRCMRRKGC